MSQTQSSPVTGPAGTPQPTAPAVPAPSGFGQISIPTGFVFSPVGVKLPGAAPTTAPPLGPLAAFTGTFTGNGFNTIFRPDNPTTPTTLPIQVSSDNVLELNLTQENLTFSPSLGQVPNRGEVQGDINLNGVPYLQTITDITSQPHVGIHVEPGLWMAVPSTTDPADPSASLVRMASIPHGTTINAQGTSFPPSAGPPDFANPRLQVDITPFAVDPVTGVHHLIKFPSQTVANQGTARLPQDLTGIPITQPMLDNPNSVLAAAIQNQNIVSTTTIVISTSPLPPLFGGGTDNIAFLLGDAGALTNPNAPGQNAQAVSMSAVFWIETVEHTITFPFTPGAGSGPLEVKADGHKDGTPSPTFLLTPSGPLPDPFPPITVQTTQIQYSQTVILNFNGLSWPHVSVATLVPAFPIPLPFPGNI